MKSEFFSIYSSNNISRNLRHYKVKVYYTPGAANPQAVDTPHRSHYHLNQSHHQPHPTPGP